MTKFDTEKIRSQLKRWQEKLLDMSKSNPLLGLNRARAAKFKLKSPDIFALFQQLAIDSNELSMPLVKKVKKRATNDLFNQNEADEEKEIFKIKEGDIEVEISTPADLKRKLRRIYDNSRSTVEERGAVTLYAAFGVIHWSDDALGDSVSPILLVPCEFIYKGPNVALRLRMADEEIQINPAILYYFREIHKIDLSGLKEKFDKKELDKDSLKTLLKDIKKAIGEQKWQVAEEVWLGTFSFESLVLYQDLKLLAEHACSNKLIAAFAHAIKGKGAEESSEALGEDLDSLKTPDVVPVATLPVDSSQLKALTYASMGRHLVIHGPPGTGKSQTISNIIADALGKNKKVLFVSAKMAALNVVFNRLKKEALGQFCLEAHGTKAGKMKIIEELKSTLESDDYNNTGPLGEELEALRRTREQLNKYVIALHTVVNPLGFSVFRAIGQFAKLQKAPDVRGTFPWENVLEVPKEEITACLEAFNGVDQMSELFNSRNFHPWRGFTHLDYNIQLQEQVEADLKFLLQSFKDTGEIVKRLKKLLPIQSFTYEDLSALTPALDAISRVTKLPENWWSDDTAKITKKKKFFNEAASLAKEYKEKELQYSQFSTLPLKETTELLFDVDGSFKQLKNRITISYFRWQKKVKQKLQPNVKGGFRNFQNYYQVSKRLAEIEDWFRKKTSLLTKEVSQSNLKDVDALEKVVSDCQATFLLKDILEDRKWKKSKITFIDPEISNSAAALVSLLSYHNKSINEAASKIDKLWPNGFAGKTLVLQTPVAQFQIRADEILSNLDKLRDWTLLQRSMKRCEDLGLGSFLEAKDVKADYLSDAFEKRFLKIWIDAAISRTPCLADFSSFKQQELISKFKILDARIRRLANLHIKASVAAASRTVKSAQSGLGRGSEVGILQHEMQKKKRIMPLRKLFSEIPRVLQTLKPCMLMSPISVSTFLKPGVFHFDLVIFDEASQLPTPEAIPAILRADQVIVAGDSNQLPPTSFFRASLIEEDKDYEEELYAASLESLLDDCVAVEPILQRQPLRWHYRSRDERLINFSNYYFYDNRLITFPPPNTDNNGRGVRLEFISDGVWDRGKSRTNRKEARRVAQLTIEHFKKFPDRSLGIVALNSTQREAIEEALDEERSKHIDLEPFFSSLREEPFFIKSLENVQGDERDVIIISVGYGKDRNGALTLNFGPLNMEGGWRRLNVLVTRAKWQVILITSMRSAELHRVNPQNRGAVALKNYIEYAEREGILPLEPSQSTDGETNDFEDSVRAVLMERGFTVDAQVGAGNFRIDLGIRDPRDKSRYLIGIECDGATYHSSRVARDRDLLREEILRGMGWKIYRIWSTEWFQNRDTAIKLMLDNLDRARARDITETVPAASLIETDFDFKPIPAPKIKKKYQPGIPYKKYRRRHRRETLMRNTNAYRLEGILINLIDFEGPIHEYVLHERLKEVFGVAKIGANINSNVKEALESARYDKEIEQRKSFIWKRGKKLKTFRTSSDDAKRLLRHISSQEITLAILYLVEDQFGIMKEQIPQSVARVFEIGRTDPDENDRIREIIDELIEKKQLVLNGNRVNLA
jgi:superfamily I DNA and/or RNA helicase/very-short-patch-repair endonuclease